METETTTTNDRQQQIHRRVQKRIAGKYLDQIDPDGILKNEYDGDRLTEFRQLDSDTKKKFDAQNNRFRKIESAYSIQNICWLIASIGVFYYTDFYRAVLYDHRINRLWFNIGALSVAVNVCIAIFLIVYLSYIKKVSSDDWERKYPSLIPIATAAFVFGGIFLTVGLWPLWGPFTPFILFVLFMGFVVMVAMLPNF
ncbi:transmembrane protein 128-like [Ruditapes philippinarum]|uniref:transmembrane protein 128-like n=1 Tax=Ruditapes philippinarum TaxID=129788 RepID=UPI00295B5528|nr:transmembrane protein 128-like [Ruditapes philippinarum]